MMNLYNRLHELFEYKDGFLYRKVAVQGAPAGIKVGTKQSNGYSYVVVDGKKILTHRVMFLFCNGYLPDFIDHIDGNKSNNKIENLRQATRAENGHNRQVYSNNKSGIKNVTWIERLKKWSVKLTVNKKRIHIGSFDDLELAELVAIEARNKYHGVFANHSFKGA